MSGDVEKYRELICQACIPVIPWTVTNKPRIPSWKEGKHEGRKFLSALFWVSGRTRNLLTYHIFKYDGQWLEFDCKKKKCSLAVFVSLMMIITQFGVICVIADSCVVLHTIAWLRYMCQEPSNRWIKGVKESFSSVCYSQRTWLTYTGVLKGRNWSISDHFLLN